MRIRSAILVQCQRITSFGSLSVAAAKIDTRLDTAGRKSGSNEIPGVESVTARLILEEMLRGRIHWLANATSKGAQKKHLSLESSRKMAACGLPSLLLIFAVGFSNDMIRCKLLLLPESTADGNLRYSELARDGMKRELNARATSRHNSMCCN